MEELFDKKDVFTVLNTSEAEKFEGEVGYFANDLEGLKYSIRNNDSEVLTKVVTSNDDDKPFWYDSPTGDREYAFALFLPVNKVKVQYQETKYRPFNDFEEFKNKTGLRVGSCVTLRLKDRDCDTEYISENLITNMVSEFKHSRLEDQHIYFGITEYTFTELLKVFEYKDLETGEWCKFGVKE